MKRIFDRIARLMIFEHTKVSIEELVSYFEKDREDPGDGGFVGEVIITLYDHSNEMGKSYTVKS